mmetsp:Transcript_5937/g.7475  ORF Transcript_5937/g.7475 Transcript_5937/m.7475 type:complete len:368 (+) Transcript_5937:45-1148(+)
MAYQPDDEISLSQIEAAEQQIEAGRLEAATKNRYETKIEGYRQFLGDKLNTEEVLPLNRPNVQKYMTYMYIKSKKSNKEHRSFEPYKQLIAALRNYSRQNGYTDVSCLDLDLKHTTGDRKFANFVKGFRKQINFLPKKKAKPLKSDLLGNLIRHIQSDENHAPQYIKDRDANIFISAKLGGLRACEIQRSAPDKHVFNESVDEVQVEVLNGKSGELMPRLLLWKNEGMSFDFVGMLKRFCDGTITLHEEGILTPDKYGMKMYVTYDYKKQQIKNNRVDSGVITKIIRSHLAAYFRLNHPEYSQQQIEETVKMFSSHSFKRGLGTEAYENGESSKHIQYGLGHSNEITQHQYINEGEVENPVLKKMKF